MTDDKPPEVGWLHYRLAVAACSAFVTGVMLLVIPLVLAIGGAAGEPLVLYAFVFSKWGGAVFLAAAVLGFALGSERMANFFAIVWGTHPLWSEVGGRLEDWREEHRSGAAILGFGLVAVVVGIFRYAFR